MTLHVPPLPFSLDPLIAEAKQRMRRRRLLLLGLLALLVAIALAFALHPLGGAPAGRSAQTASSSRALADLKVPLDATERQWRAKVRYTLGLPVVTRSTALRIRHHVLAVAEATGAELVRIRIWRGTSPAAVEVVLATNVNAAVYLRHRTIRLVRLFPRPVYVNVVDSRGKSFFEWGGVDNEGFVGVPPALQRCSPVSAWGNWGETPCPAK